MLERSTLWSKPARLTQPGSTLAGNWTNFSQAAQGKSRFRKVKDLGQTLWQQLKAPLSDKVTGVIVLVFKTMLMSLPLDASHEAAVENWRGFSLKAQQTRLLNKNEASEQKHKQKHKRAGSSTSRLRSACKSADGAAGVGAEDG